MENDLWYNGLIYLSFLDSTLYGFFILSIQREGEPNKNSWLPIYIPTYNNIGAWISSLFFSVVIFFPFFPIQVKYKFLWFSLGNCLWRKKMLRKKVDYLYFLFLVYKKPSKKHTNCSIMLKIKNVFMYIKVISTQKKI